MTTATPRKKNRNKKSFRPELPYEWNGRIKKLMSYTTVSTAADAVRRALTVYCALIERQQDGWSVVLKKGNEEKLLSIN